MSRNDEHGGMRFLGPRVASPGRSVTVVALAWALALSACATDGDTFDDETTTETTVSETTPSQSRSPEELPTGVEPTTSDESTGPESRQGEDAAWFAEADYACSVAVDEYGVWKVQAGDSAAPEALALGAAAAATHAADSIGALPEPASADALTLREAVLGWAAAYRELSTAMDSGSYSEVMAAGDAAQASADRIRSAAASQAMWCAVMADEV
jgi:hypothetical protein